MAAQTAPIGFVGLGNLGLPMARALVVAGQRVIGHDVRGEVAGPATDAGVEWEPDLATLARAVQLVSVMVFDAAQARVVITGPGGLVEHLPRHSTIALHSTVGPAVAIELAAAVQAAGHRLVDAAVCGRADQAAAGRIRVLVGGASEAVAACAPVLQALGEVRVVGDVGTGQALKLANNLMIAGNRAVAYEAARLVAPFGIDDATLRTVLGDCTGSSQALLDGPQFDAALLGHTRAGEPGWADDFAKDVRLALDAASDPAELPVASLLSTVLPGIYERRRGDLDATRAAL